MKMVFPSLSLQANFHSNGGHHQHYCSSLSGSFVLGRHHHHHHQADGRQSYPCPFGCCCLLCSPLDSTTCCCCRHTGQTRSPITCIAPFLCDSKCSLLGSLNECQSVSLSLTTGASSNGGGGGGHQSLCVVSVSWHRAHSLISDGCSSAAAAAADVFCR